MLEELEFLARATHGAEAEWLLTTQLELIVVPLVFVDTIINIENLRHLVG